jgi:hypothetical protein
VAMMRNFEVMLGQMLNHYLEFCNFEQCHICKLFSLLNIIREVGGLLISRTSC